MFGIEANNSYRVDLVFETREDAQDYADYMNGSYLGNPWKVVEDADPTRNLNRKYGSPE